MLLEDLKFVNSLDLEWLITYYKNKQWYFIGTCEIAKMHLFGDTPDCLAGNVQDAMSNLKSLYFDVLSPKIVPELVSRSFYQKFMSQDQYLYTRERYNEP